MKPLKQLTVLCAVLAVAGSLEGCATRTLTPPPPPSASASRGHFNQAGLRQLDEAMAAAVAAGEVPGLTYMLVRHGEVVAFNSFGQASPSRGLAQQNDSIVRIFSMTKPITGVAMMTLYEEGRWQLDDPITKFLPEFDHLQVMTGVDSAGNPITEPARRPPTMRELMSHTAGFGYGLVGQNPVDAMFRARGVNGSDNLEQVASKVADIPLLFQPGEGWSYSIAVDLQARIVEVITGESFASYLQRRIFTPLRMTDTGFYVPPEKVGRFADLYGRVPASGRIVPVPPSFAPNLDYINPTRLQSGGAGLVSTASDYGRFCQMILNGGQLDGARILRPETIALMGSNVIPDTVRPDSGLVAAMGTTAFGFRPGVGFGLDFMVISDPQQAALPVGRGTLSWGGAAGTWFWIDPENDMYFIGLIQRLGGATGQTDLPGVSQRLVYSALDPVHP